MNKQERRVRRKELTLVMYDLIAMIRFTQQDRIKEILTKANADLEKEREGLRREGAPTVKGKYKMTIDKGVGRVVLDV